MDSFHCGTCGIVLHDIERFLLHKVECKAPQEVGVALPESLVPPTNDNSVTVELPSIDFGEEAEVFEEDEDFDLPLQDQTEEDEEDVDDVEPELFEEDFPVAKPVRAFPCKVCNKSFAKKFDLEMHGRIHTGERPFQCVICGRGFMQKANVLRHVALHKVWAEKAVTTEPVMSVSRSTFGQKVEVLFRCNLCQEEMVSKSEIRQHLKVHSDEKVFKCFHGDCGETFDEANPFAEHVKQHEGTTFSCQFGGCGRLFSDLDVLNIHQLTHSAPKTKTSSSPKAARKDDLQHHCHDCSKSFASAVGLHNHRMKTTHAKSCKLCGICLRSNNDLVKHRKEVHPELMRDRTCPVCFKIFRAPRCLLDHLIIHTGELPFQCSVCDQAFNRKDKLARHELMHSGVMLKCSAEDCDREFYRKDKLNEHEKTHIRGPKTYPCKLCPETYPSSGELARHKKNKHRDVRMRQLLKCFEKGCRKKFKLEIERTRHHEKVHNLIHRFGVEVDEEEEEDSAMQGEGKAPMEVVVMVDEDET